MSSLKRLTKTMLFWRGYGFASVFVIFGSLSSALLGSSWSAFSSDPFSTCAREMRSFSDLIRAELAPAAPIIADDSLNDDSKWEKLRRLDNWELIVALSGGVFGSVRARNVHEHPSLIRVALGHLLDSIDEPLYDLRANYTGFAKWMDEVHAIPDRRTLVSVGHASRIARPQPSAANRVDLILDSSITIAIRGAEESEHSQRIVSRLLRDISAFHVFNRWKLSLGVVPSLLPESNVLSDRRMPEGVSFRFPQYLERALPSDYWEYRSNLATDFGNMGIGRKDNSAQILNDSYILAEVVLAAALDERPKILLTSDWGFYYPLKRYRESFTPRQQSEMGLRVDVVHEKFQEILGPGALLRLNFTHPLAAEVYILVLETTKSPLMPLWFVGSEKRGSH